MRAVYEAQGYCDRKSGWHRKKGVSRSVPPPRPAHGLRSHIECLRHWPALQPRGSLCLIFNCVVFSCMFVCLRVPGFGARGLGPRVLARPFMVPNPYEFVGFGVTQGCPFPPKSPREGARLRPSTIGDLRPRISQVRFTVLAAITWNGYRSGLMRVLSWVIRALSRAKFLV